MPTVGATTAIQIASSSTNPDGSDRPISFRFHADAANTAVIRLSAISPDVTDNYEEYLPGTGESIEDFIGTIYAIAVTGTQTYHIPYIQYSLKAEKV